MKSYYENESGKLLQGSALEILRQLEGESVQCCVTSPPYWNLRDYGVEGQLGLESTPEEYVEKMVEIFREVKRVLKKDGTLWLNLGDSYAGSWKGGNQEGFKNEHCKKINPGFSSKEIKPKDLIGIPWKVAFALQADGWYLRQDIIWSKPNPMPESVKDRCTKAHEYIFLLSKSAKYYYDAESIREAHKEPWRGKGEKEKWYTVSGIQRALGRKSDTMSTRGVREYNPLGKNKLSVWEITTHPFPGAHFATFPEKLIIPCILAGSSPGDIVFDPFMGSGTVAVVSHKLGRSWLGIELSKDYCEIARARIEEASKQGIIPGFNE